ncbi:MAG: hypothetical protein AAF499_14205, partial [Pseudomonadota bacterium]
VLNAETIAQLQSAGVSTVMVELSQDDLQALVSSQPEQEDPETRFVLNDTSHPLIKKLVEVAREHRA